ncbi:HAD family hydrolase [Undibacterium sp. LX40W]|uniref:HAD family hydrolase n=1 Tax=Undibacterium nitidum TaxID=2762298 RepID=A0A923KTU6_9BURK|nr:MULTISPECIES: HAD family hydrolase [Undibacterium]MBC3881597.1 HAD family hydrolase [Undibacterium nitidum]MBC3891620.1 HAD family hydrolase [Undibacterium sp. LX40W]
MTSRRLIIFDLDETLVHATETKLSYEPNFVVEPYFIYLRPYVHELLKFTANRFDIAVWSSSSPQYVMEVTKQIFGETYPLKFAWSIEKCVQKVDAKTNSYVYVKDLRKVQSQGYIVENITIVDDSPEKIVRQPRSHLLVKPYQGECDDVGLIAVQEALETLNLHLY